MKKRTIGILSVFLVVALMAAVLVGCGPNVKVGNDTAVAEDPSFSEDFGNYAIVVNLIIGNPDPDKAPFFSGKVTLRTLKHMAFEAVEAACTEKSIDIVDLNGYSSFISSINGIGSRDNGDGTYSYWSTSINGVFSPGLGAQQLRDGDLFEIQYITVEKTW